MAGLQKIFTDNYSIAPTVPGFIRLLKGTRPANNEVASVAANILDNGSSIVLNHTKFTAVNNGRCDLISPITIPIKSSQTNQVPTCIRWVSAVAATTSLMDIDVNNVAGTSNALINTMSISTGNTVQITDLRLILKLNNGLSMSPVLLNALLETFTGYPSTRGYVGALLMGCSWVLDSSGYQITTPLAIEAWSGTVPATSEIAPTGTLLWKKTISFEENCIFTPGPNILFVKNLYAANAIANGTPTFIRIVKDAVDYSPYTYPKMVIQLPVSSAVSFNNPTMATGAINMLNPFSFHILPVA